MRNLIFLCAVTMLTACATSPVESPGTFLPPEQRTALTNTKPCCTNFASLPFQRLPKQTEREFSLTPRSPSFDFTNGRSYFAAFSIQEGSRSLTLKSFPVNMLLNRYGHVFVPSVIFLDSSFKQTVEPSLSFNSRNPSIVGRSWAEATVNIPVEARYLVIYDSRSEGSLAWRDSDQLGGFLRVRPGPTGDISVSTK